MDNDKNWDKHLWDSIGAEDDKKEFNQNRVYYRHNRPFESMGEQNVIDQSSVYESSVDDSKDFNERQDFLDILENQELFAALKKLKKSDLEVIVLRYRSGLSFKDIAQRLNISFDTVKKKHIRALAKLRMILDKKDKKIF